MGDKTCLSGVYAIIHRSSRRCYIGSSVKVDQRLQGHLHRLSHGTHKNAPLQFAWNEYGAEAFEFVILETCQRSECLMREQAWMILRRCTDPKFGFNIKTYANGSGFTKHTREQKQRMLDGMRHRARRPQTAATREKIANALRGKPLNADRKAKIARAHAKPETKARISAAQKIRWQLLKGGQIAS